MKQNCWKGKRFKLCSFSQKYNKAGRNSSGRITAFHRGGGSKRLLRRIDFKRNILSTGIVERIEYDPNRSARIALVKWRFASGAALGGLEFEPNVRVESEAFKETHKGGSQSSLGRAERDQQRRSTIVSLAPPLTNVESCVNQKLNVAPRGEAYFSYILACDKLQLQATIINTFCQSDNFNMTHTLRLADNTPLNVAENEQQKRATSLLQLRSQNNNFMLGSLCTADHPSSAVDKMYQQVGNCIPLGFIPIGTFVHNIEQRPGQGGQLVRAAGTFAQLVQKLQNIQQSVVRLPSGILKQLDSQCRATIGVVSNSSHNTIKLTKAGQNRWLGKRPIVRGVAMNPIDHPHGGGEGRSKGGRPSVSPWGKPTKGGFKTVIRKRATGMLQLRSKK